MTKKEQKELYDLYFIKCCSIKELIEHFKNKYSYLDIRTAIRKILESK